MRSRDKLLRYDVQYCLYIDIPVMHLCYIVKNSINAKTVSTELSAIKRLIDSADNLTLFHKIKELNKSKRTQSNLSCIAHTVVEFKNQMSISS